MTWRKRPFANALALVLFLLWLVLCIRVFAQMAAQAFSDF